MKGTLNTGYIMKKCKYYLIFLILIDGAVTFLIFPEVIRYGLMILSFIGYLIIYLIIEKKDKKISKEMQSNQFILFVYFSLLSGKRIHESLCEAYQHLDKKMFSEIEQLSSDDVRLNRLDAYFSYLPFTLMKKLLYLDNYRKDIISSFKILLTISNIYASESENQQKINTYVDLIKSAIANTLFFAFIIILFSDIYTLLLTKHIFIIIFCFEKVAMTLIVFIASILLLNDNKYLFKKILFKRFLSSFLFYVQTETPYNAFLLANNILTKAGINEFENLKASYQNLDLQPTLKIIKKYPYPYFEDGMLLIYRLVIKNDFRNSDNQTVNELLGRLKHINENYKEITSVFKICLTLILAFEVIILLREYMEVLLG